MASIFSSLSKTLLLAVVLVSMGGASPRSLTVEKVAGNALASKVYFPEVRLRKLHLVRPDLIPYPIYFDIYC